MWPINFCSLYPLITVRYMNLSAVKSYHLNNNVDTYQKLTKKAMVSHTKRKKQHHGQMCNYEGNLACQVQPQDMWLRPGVSRTWSVRSAK